MKHQILSDLKCLSEVLNVVDMFSEDIYILDYKNINYHHFNTSAAVDTEFIENRFRDVFFLFFLSLSIK